MHVKGDLICQWKILYLVPQSAHVLRFCHVPQGSFDEGSLASVGLRVMKTTGASLVVTDISNENFQRCSLLFSETRRDPFEAEP